MLHMWHVRHTWHVHMGVGYTLWGEIRRPHGDMWHFVMTLAVNFSPNLQMWKNKAKRSVTKTRCRSSLQVLTWTSSWFVQLIDIPGILMFYFILTMFLSTRLSRPLPTPGAHQSQMMTHLRHTGSLLYFVLQITVSLPSSSLILSIRPNHVFTP